MSRIGQIQETPSHSIRQRLEDEARFADGDSFMDMASMLIPRGDEHLYQVMAEIAATEGNLSVIQAIGGSFYLDYDSIATMARTYGHFNTAGWITGGEEVAVFQRDLPTTDDLEDERSDQAQMWQNMGGFSIIKTDAPLEAVDTTPRYQIMGTRKWGWKEDPDDLEVTHTRVMWTDSP